MLMAVNTIFEMAATLICVNYLFGKRYYFSIYDAVFMVAEVTLIESANYFGLSKGMAFFGYVGIYIYELLKFKCSIRKANVNLVLFIIIGVFSQVVCSIPAFILEGYLSIDLLVISVNVFMIILMLILGKKGLLYKISNIILNYDRWIYVATILCLVGAVYLLVIYKMEEYLRVTDYIIFGIWTLLIAVLIVRWQQEKYEKLSKEREYEIHKTYDGVYTQLLDSMRKKQHDFHNHITAIYSHHLMAKDYDTLVALQKKYCDEIMEENRYARLLSSNSPIVIAFLYSKFIEAESKGCRITYDIKVDELQCKIPDYKLIEVLGILLDNAIEAVQDYDLKNIWVEMREMTDIIHVAVKNNSRYYKQEGLIQLMGMGYSTKAQNRGIGLSKAKDILMEYECDLRIYCEENENTRIVFDFTIEKSQRT